MVDKRDKLIFTGNLQLKQYRNRMERNQGFTGLLTFTLDLSHAINLNKQCTVM